MADQKADRDLRSLIFKAIVPKGFRPTTSKDIEAMLDGMGGERMPEDRLQRMLRKVRGEKPIGVSHNVSEATYAELSRQQEELVALYRARGREIPPDVLAKLEEMRKRAAGHDVEGNSGEV